MKDLRLSCFELNHTASLLACRPPINEHSIITVLFSPCTELCDRSDYI